MPPQEHLLSEAKTTKTRRMLNGSSELSEPLLPRSGDNEGEECDLLATILATPPTASDCCGSNASNQGSSRNVTIILWYTVFVFCGRSIWNQNVLANYAFLLKGGDPKAVGYLTAAMGISQLLVGFPAGYLADKYRRDTLLKIASGIGVAAVGTSIWALHMKTTAIDTNTSATATSNDAAYRWLMVSLSVWGIYWGCAQTSLTALYADSVPDGQRSLYFTRRSILIKVGQLAGPLGALLLFVKLGDEWTLHECSSVMTVGQLICLPAVALLWCLNDDDSDATPKPPSRLVLAPSDSSLPSNILLEETATNVQSIARQETNFVDEAPTEELDTPSGDEGAAADTNGENATSNDKDETYDSVQLAAWLPCLSSKRAIPTLVAVADVTAGLASGMSIRYFAIFLVDNLKIGPIMVQVLYIVAPLIQVALMQSIQRLAKTKWGGGRCQMAVLFKWIGITLMLLMVWSYRQAWPRWVTCTILILRTAFMNSPSALTRSVLMDHVPKTERAQWSALETLNMFSWSGSAALGGILVDSNGILFNFCVTASLQFLATLPLFLLSFFRQQEDESAIVVLPTTNDEGVGENEGDEEVALLP